MWRHPAPASMRLPAPLLALAALVLAGCATPAADVPGATPDAPADEGAIRFLVWGDAGTGKEEQYHVAESALALCKARGCDFVLQTGDNVYERGVESPADPQFDEKFEKPNADFAIPFYLVLGNHDAGTVLGGEGLDVGRGDHQVAYSTRTDRASDKWNMPARYYAVEKPGVLILGLDTNDALWGKDAAVNAQASWLEKSLSESDAAWKFAFAHHPLYSNGQHGDAGAGDYTSTPLLRDFLREGLCGKVDVYFAGHDHDLQWLKARDDCGRTEFVVSGAAAKTRSLLDDHNPAWFAEGDTLGFFWVELKGDTFRATVHDGDGKQLYERSFQRVAA